MCPRYVYMERDSHEHYNIEYMAKFDAAKFVAKKKHTYIYMGKSI